MGSPLYMSPEQVRNAKQVDARTDIWALGVILHELLTGAPAFIADTLPGICAAITADDPPPLRSLREDAPVELEAVLIEVPREERHQAIPDDARAHGRAAPVRVRSGRHRAQLDSGRADDARGTSSLPPPRSRVGRDSGSGTPAIRAPRGGAPRSGGKPRSSQQGGAHRSRRRVRAAKCQARRRSRSSTATRLAARRCSAEGAAGERRKIALVAAGALLAAGATSARSYGRAQHTTSDAADERVRQRRPLPAAAPSSFSSIPRRPGRRSWEGDSALGHAPMQISIDNEAARKAAASLRGAARRDFCRIRSCRGRRRRTCASMRRWSPLPPKQRERRCPPSLPPGAVTAPAAPRRRRWHPRQRAWRGFAQQRWPRRPAARLEPSRRCAVSHAATPAPSAATPPPPPSDIRLQR